MEKGVVKLVIGKPLRCREGHVLGLVEKRAGVQRLHVLRMSEYEFEPQDEHVGMLPESWFVGEIVEGMVRCSICGYQRKFVQGVNGRNNGKEK